MPYDGYGGDEGFPHDGKQGRCGCGEGYSWDIMMAATEEAHIKAHPVAETEQDY